MRVLPFKRVHDSEVGRRIYFIYGDVFDHAKIDDATMRQSVPSFFGNGNMTFFEHISLMIRRAGRSTPRGATSTSPHPDRYRMPITFLTGEHNRMFVPRGLEATHDAAARGQRAGALQPPRDPRTTRTWTAGSATDAERDVFPIALAELERHN